MITRQALPRSLVFASMVALFCAPATLRAALPCDELGPMPPQAGCPESMVITEGGSVDGWTVWVGWLCLPATVTDVARLLLDDAGTCRWRDCESVCRIPTTRPMPEGGGPIGEENCNQTTFTMLERKLLAVIPVRLGSLTDRVVQHDDGRLTVGYSASAGSSGTRYGVPVVSRSHAVFTAEPVAEDRVFVQYCQWGVPPPVLGMVSTSIGNRAAKKDVRRTLRSMEKALREPRPTAASDPPYLSCTKMQALVCPAE